MTDWDDPASRFALVDRVGPDEYNRLFEQHVKDSTVKVVNGYGIRTVGSRWGRLFQVLGTTSAFFTLQEAENHAWSLECGPHCAEPHP